MTREQANKRGWRMIGGKPYCPYCANKMGNNGNHIKLPKDLWNEMMGVVACSYWNCFRTTYEFLKDL